MNNGDISKQNTASTSDRADVSMSDKFMENSVVQGVSSIFATVAIGVFCFLPETWQDKIRSKFDTPTQG